MPPVKKIFLLSLIILITSGCCAQHFTHSAVLNRIDSTGFYSISISAKLSAYIKPDFSDLRIAEKKQWVPHILRPGQVMLSENLFTNFPILQNSLTDSGKNFLLLENTIAGGIYNIKLLLKNTAVNRVASLSGSENKKDWYIINDNIMLGRSSELVKDEYMQEIRFPLIKYRYLKLIIDNAGNDPLLISKAGFYEEPAGKPPVTFLQNPMPEIRQIDSNGSSYISVRQQLDYHFDRVSLMISGPRYYSRELAIYLPIYKKNGTAEPGALVGTYKVMSQLPAVFEFNRMQAPMFFIVIRNGDNPALKIDSVITGQQPMSLLSFLEQGKTYELVFADALARAPHYDLQLFRDSIQKATPLMYGDIQPMRPGSTTGEVAKKTYWVWILIIIAIVALSYLSYRMITEMDKSKT